MLFHSHEDNEMCDELIALSCWEDKIRIYPGETEQRFSAPVMHSARQV